MPEENEDAGIQSKPKTPRSKAAKRRGPSSKGSKSKQKAAKPERPYPRAPLKEAVEIPLVIRHKNGGNPWPPSEIAEALGRGGKTPAFYYLTSASRDFGLTSGSRDTAEISLTELGRRLAYAETPQEERSTRIEAFLSVDLFRQVLEYYKGSSLPEMKYLRNTLENKFHLNPAVHEEFAVLFRKNCDYLGISEGMEETITARTPAGTASSIAVNPSSSDFVTVAEPENDTGKTCFVAMPFSEKDSKHPAGFFSEVLKQIVAPAGRKAGFRVVTARKKGSDVIHSTIMNGLLDADLVVVDLTEHNPNVLFELGMRLAEDKPVALIRATGTTAIFDVDNMLRVEEYNPCLWPSTVEADIPKLAEHIEGTWNNRNDTQTYMKILRSKREQK
jgi:nucleoside 2-deoxyribosyltransferase